jgi:predicted nucleic acid-binding protein
MAKAAVYNMSEGLVVELDQHLAVWGANLGLEHKLPLADSIILAIARAHNATIWTQDEHFRNIEGVRFCEPEPMQS